MLGEILKWTTVVLVAVLMITITTWLLFSFFINLKEKSYKKCLLNVVWLYGTAMVTAYIVSEWFHWQWMTLPADTSHIVLWILFIAAIIVGVCATIFIIKVIIMKLRERWYNVLPIIGLLLWIKIWLYFYDLYFAKLLA